MDFERLLNEGRLAWTSRQEPRALAVALACDASASDLDFEYEPEASLNTFLDDTYVVTYLRDPAPALALADSAPLREVLLRALPEAVMHLPKLPMTKKRWYEPREHWSFMGTVPTETARKALQFTGAFYGLAGICRCGEIGCGSSYAWIQDRVVLLAIEKDGSDLEIHLFPCRIAV